ncbi:MAG: RibD family protein [Bdellovibrionales bacterium]|nr:RibD family protein [Bdellovibrionales bacterium]
MKKFPRPEILLKAAISLDGYLDDSLPRRRILSGPEDLAEVAELRAACDAILVGAGTLRADNPRLHVHSERLRAARVELGHAPQPLRVSLTASGALDPRLEIFQTADPNQGERPPLIYTPEKTAERLRATLQCQAEVAGAPGDRVEFEWLLADLARRGIKQLLVEGGSEIIEQLLRHGLADLFRLAVAQSIFGKNGGVPLWKDDRLFTVDHAYQLSSARQVGQMTVLTYSRHPATPSG